MYEDIKYEPLENKFDENENTIMLSSFLNFVQHNSNFSQ